MHNLSSCGKYLIVSPVVIISAGRNYCSGVRSSIIPLIWTRAHLRVGSTPRWRPFPWALPSIIPVRVSDVDACPYQILINDWSFSQGINEVIVRFQASSGIVRSCERLISVIHVLSTQSQGMGWGWGGGIVGRERERGGERMQVGYSVDWVKSWFEWHLILRWRQRYFFIFYLAFVVSFDTLSLLGDCTFSTDLIANGLSDIINL